MSKSHRAAHLRSAALAITASALLAPAAHAAGPVITGIDQRYVQNLAGSTFVISGSGFTGATAVDASGKQATFTVVSDHTIRATFTYGYYASPNIMHVTADGISSPDTTAAEFRTLVRPRPSKAVPVACTLGSGAPFDATFDIEFNEAGGANAGARASLGAVNADLVIPAQAAGSTDPLAAIQGNATVTSFDTTVTGATQTSLDLAAPGTPFSFAAGTSVDGNALAFPAALSPTSSIDLLPQVGLVSVSFVGYHAHVTVAGAPASLDCLPKSGPTLIRGIYPSAPVPLVAGISPSTGPATGGTPVRITGSGFLPGMTVKFGATEATAVRVVSSTEIEATSPPMPAGQIKVVVYYESTGSTTTFQSIVDPTPTPSPSLSPTPAIPSVDLALKGAATLKTLTTGSVPLTGSLKGSLTGGAFTGDLALNPAPANLIALGFLQVQAKLAFTQMTPTTGTLSSAGVLTTSTKVRVKLPSVKVFGLELIAGLTCQGTNPTILNLRSPAFSAAGGGRLTGAFAISNLNGCGSLNGLVSSLTAGNNNAIALTATPSGAPAAS